MSNYLRKGLTYERTFGKSAEDITLFCKISRRVKRAVQFLAFPRDQIKYGGGYLISAIFRELCCSESMSFSFDKHSSASSILAPFL